MAKRVRRAVEKYHDRVAGLYDGIYDGDPYWEAVFHLTWRNLKRYLPSQSGQRSLDLGCGTGRWGLRLLRGGFSTDFLDISQKMLDQTAGKLARQDRAWESIDLLQGAEAVFTQEPALSQLYHADLDQLQSLPSARYHLIVGQGDPLNAAEHPFRSFRELVRLLAPGGVLVLSVDNRLQGLEHYLEQGDVAGLSEFLRSGRTQWVTDNPAERFSLTMFTPGQIRRLAAANNLELLSLIGKPVLPLRRHKDLLRDPGKREILLRLEEDLQTEEALFANAPHLEFAAKKPGELVG
ncbi:MAG: class I SAM-dependent methyltransferase [Planctomycetota bacterium]|jgi:SAM-dependent methyltransferase|nr:class I SAM-dependent methyltransferase [Planctomycetota bacterium]